MSSTAALCRLSEITYREYRGQAHKILRQQLIEEAEKVSVKEVCRISFVPTEGNAALIKLIDDTFAGRETSAPPEHIDAMAALTLVPSSEIPSRTKRSS
jgi:hypothetical protein